jgi:hydroxymethylpyrimidine pyrophosphatase-like HAD family hydrolase
MLVAFDIDGTLDANPPVFLSLMQALRAAGHRVAVLTGCSGPKVTPENIVGKEEYLQKLGFGAAYDQLVVFPDPPAERKAEWLKTNKADVLIDNSIENVKAAADYCLCLVPWQTRIKDK